MDKYLLYFFIFYAIHYRIYYCLDMSASIYVEVILAIVAFAIMATWLIVENYKDWLLICPFFTALYLLGGYYIGSFLFENKLFYNTAEQKFGMVYSSELIRKYNQRRGMACDVRLINGTSREFYIFDGIKASKKYNLFVYPKLAHDDEFGYYSIYRKRLFETRPTDIQLEYCKNGARLSEKINSLKKYSGVVLENDLLDYMAHINQHDNRIISAVVERRGEKYLFANVLQSDDKLWAFKYRDVEEGKKVLIIYDISSPHLFFVIDWNPSEEEYEYYNTKDGQKPTFKYLLKLEHLSSSIQAKNDEERVED